MNASFEEKSVWIQLFSLVTILGAYLVGAGILGAGMFRSDEVRALGAFVPLIIAAIVLLVVVMTVGHVVVAIFSGAESRDERDRIIDWRAESNASWVLAAGVLASITGMIFEINNVWIAHLLMLTLLLYEALKLTMQLVYYRRGV